MKLKSVKQNVLRNVGMIIVPFLINVLCKSLKIKIEGQSFEEISSKPLIAAFWHGKMVVPWFLMGNLKSAALVSLSKDGELLSNLLNYWNYRLIRGSSSIGGKEALELMEEQIRNGYSIAITPDGPRGPKEEMKAGTVVLAKKTSAPIYLLSVKYSNSKKFNSWDNFELPLPFSKVKVRVSEPIYVKSDLSYKDTSKKITEINRMMIEENQKIEI